MSLTPAERALCRAVELVLSVDPRRIAKARENGGLGDSGRVGVPWAMFVALADAIEEADPGWIERSRAALIEQTGTSRYGGGRRKGNP